MRSLKTLILIGGGWLALAAFIFFFLGNQNIPKLRAIAAESDSIEGTVSSTDCANHAVVSYQYEIGAHVYTGQTSFGGVCNNLKSGDKITVYYARQSPELSELTDPSKALRNEIMAAGAAAIFGPPVIILGIFLKIKRSAPQPSD